MAQNYINNVWARLNAAVKGIPYGNTYALLADDGTIGGLGPFRKFYLDPLNGVDTNDGQSPATAVKTLAVAYGLCTTGKNDTVVLMGNGLTTATARVESSFTWSKDSTHLIGACSPVLTFQRARIAPTGSTTAFTPFFTISGNGCIFQNISWYHGFNTGTTSMINMIVSGARNYFKNCSMLGMADAASAGSAGSRSLKVGSAGSGENVFEDCTIGTDTVTRSAANASLELAGGTPRNIFRGCIFPFMTSSATVLGILGTGASCIDRMNYFENCSFENAIKSSSTAMTALVSLTNASPGGLLSFKSCMLVGMTKVGDTIALANSYIDMPAVSASAGGLGVNPS